MDVKLRKETCAQGDHVKKEHTLAWEVKGRSLIREVSWDALSGSAPVKSEGSRTVQKQKPALQ